MLRLTGRDVAVVMVAIGLVGVMFLLRTWKTNAERAGQQPAEPFRITGNFYFVGANDVSSFLLTGAEGHVVIDGGHPATAPLGMRYPEQAADLQRSFRALRSLPADIWVTANNRPWGRYRKFAARASARNPIDPFIDREGYRAYIGDAEAEF